MTETDDPVDPALGTSDRSVQAAALQGEPAAVCAVMQRRQHRRAVQQKLDIARGGGVLAGVLAVRPGLDAVRDLGATDPCDAVCPAVGLVGRVADVADGFGPAVIRNPAQIPVELGDLAG